ncbi:MAG TPA: TIM-barrel domain-containing protein [Opitutaceae bacterium]|jgi:alpha-glucosidase/alpha-D-xyloside xylohydrolase
MNRPILLSLAVATLAFLNCAKAEDQPGSLVLAREGRVISVVPYGPNIVRITFSTDKDAALARPGYGISAQPAADGWTRERGADGGEIYRSSQMNLQFAADPVRKDQLPQPLPLDALNLQLRDEYFGGPRDPFAPHPDALRITDDDGRALLNLRNWTLAPERPEVAKLDPADHGFRVGALFDSPADEHYYGLGQQQQGWMDLRDHEVHCWHEYSSLGGEDVGVPFLVSSQGYGLIWDNPSKTTVDLGINLRNVWSSEVGNRVSFFVIAGKTSDEIYAGYRKLTGVTHLLPRGVYGFIQSKAIYPTQQQILDLARTYRARNLPLDVVVVDFLNMTRQGELDLDLKRWPDAAAMNRELHAMNVRTLLSVWPHFAPGTQFYDLLRGRGWLVNRMDGTPDLGWAPKTIGPNIDSTNPAAANWFWEQIRDRYVKPYGFDYIWLDETEPDIDPTPDEFSIGSGVRYYNVYPLFHTAAVYDGFRRDFGDSRRVMILARAAYLGAQRNGTVFWSSDIQATWDMLKRSIPTGLNFTASGLPYWDTDIAGFFSPQIPADYHAAHQPLIDGSDAREVIGRYEDYPELFVRWYEWGAFQPVMRAHGERMHNEVWSFGKQAEPILEKFLKLRYTLLPYTYSLAFRTYRTGAPYMRALFMDFPNDPKAANLPDEYMFGPAFLVAPVTEQGATQREVYLPAGSDWYNFWTNERLPGGQTIAAAAPIDVLPLFVRAGSIIPFGADVQSGQQPQAIASVRVYPGADGTFDVYQDDGDTYTYERTGGQVTHLIWDDAGHRLSGQEKLSAKVDIIQ